MRRALLCGTVFVAVVTVLVAGMRPVEGQQGSFRNVTKASEVYGDELNTEFWEDVGSLSVHDGGRTIFITSDRHRNDPGVDERDGKKYDLWVGRREETNGPFTGFTNKGILANVNSPYDECTSHISADGLTLAWFSRRSPGVPVDIWAATRPQVMEGGQEVPFGQPFKPKGLNTASSDYAPFFSADMETIYFSSNRAEPDSEGQMPFGTFDLYRATHNADGSYSNVVNLGGSLDPPYVDFVNSPAREFNPIILEDGLRIFWAENPPEAGPVRNGDNADIWMATRATNKKPFGNVQNLGPPVNSPGDETSFDITKDWPAEGSQIWFTRVEDRALRKADIWVATWVPDKPFQRGDANVDGDLDLSDGVVILNSLFLGGPEPECLDAADTDDSGTVQITDAVVLFNYLFLDAAPPSAPFEECGPDPTDEDLLHCPSYPCP